MVILEGVVTAISKAVFSYAMHASGAESRVKARLGLEPTQAAFERALAKAMAQLQDQHPTWVSELFDGSFFEREGAAVLCQLLLRSHMPKASDLVNVWADSIGLPPQTRDSPHLRELEIVAGDFLLTLDGHLRAEPSLQALYDSKSLERIASATEALARTQPPLQPTKEMVHDYLHWVYNRHLYLDAAGVMQTYRQVQLKIEEIFIPLKARLTDSPTSSDRTLFEEYEHDIIESTSESSNSRQSESRVSSTSLRNSPSLGHALDEEVSLLKAIREHDRVLVLGAPGSGKSILVRYLALEHAQAMLEDRTQDEELGPVLFPILIRLSEYVATEQWRAIPLSSFLASACAIHECPTPDLPLLFKHQLAAGSCIVMFDGLDEIVDPDDRRVVAERLNDFVRHHCALSNKIVITSRIAGYRSAPVVDTFAQVVIQELDDASIEALIQKWCLAVEAAQTPDLSLERKQVNATREAETLLLAISSTPGVRRLATNPLLLRILALIHRSGSALPQRRIELYKIAAETLARTWRSAHGVPSSALVKDDQLTRLLGVMEIWIHENQSTGLVTKLEVQNILGAEWARMMRTNWDAEDPPPSIVEEVDRFLAIVREHTGLFIERAPNRYGFMHLTIQEYFAARQLISLSKRRAYDIRCRLHDPRWQEPILLALAFLGLDYPEDAMLLFETSILAQGEDAVSLELAPSEHEDLLGRDFLFALRCLADFVPVNPLTAETLIERLVQELLFDSGLARFSPYHATLQELGLRLKNSPYDHLLVKSLHETFLLGEPQPKLRAALLHLRRGDATPQMLEHLVGALQEDSISERIAIAAALTEHHHHHDSIIQALAPALQDDSWRIRNSASAILSRMAALSDESAATIIKAWTTVSATEKEVWAVILRNASYESPSLADKLATTMLTESDLYSPNALFAVTHVATDTHSVTQLIENYLQSEDLSLVLLAFFQLEPPFRFSELTENMYTSLVQHLANADVSIRFRAAELLLIFDHLDELAIEVMQMTLLDRDAELPMRSERRIGILATYVPALQHSMLALLESPDSQLRERGVRILARTASSTSEPPSPEFQVALSALLSDPITNIRHLAAESLASMDLPSSQVLSVLEEAVKDPNWTFHFQRKELISTLLPVSGIVEPLLERLEHGEHYFEKCFSAQIIGEFGDAYPAIIQALCSGLCDDFFAVSEDCANALAKLAYRFPDQSLAIVAALRSGIEDPEFGRMGDHTYGRSASEYAYDALWQIKVGASVPSASSTELYA